MAFPLKPSLTTLCCYVLQLSCDSPFYHRAKQCMYLGKQVVRCARVGLKGGLRISSRQMQHCRKVW